MLAHFERDHEVFFRTAAKDPDAAAPATSLDATFFDDFYAANGDDPWGFTDRWYERRKRALTLASLPRERFDRAFEPGCSIGVLTAELAARCDHLLAIDPVAAAVDRAVERTAALAHVEVRQGSVPADWPDGAFDLVVLSEVGYYCGPDDLERLVDRAAQCLTDDGVIVACHWRHPVEEYPLTGDAVHEALLAHPDLALLAQHLEDDFRLDVLVRPPARSVAPRRQVCSRDCRAPRHRRRRRRPGPRRGGAAARLPRRHRRRRATGSRTRHGRRRRSTAAPTARRSVVAARAGGGRRRVRRRGRRRRAGRGRAARALSRLAAHDPDDIWIACTDADSRVPADWLEHQVQLADGGVDLVLGTVELVGDELPTCRHDLMERNYK